MRRIGDQATRSCDRPGRDRQSAAILLALLFGLAACAPIKEGAPAKTTAGPNPPVTTEKLAPVALAPGMTGGPAAPPSAKPSPSPAATAAPPAEPAAPPAATPAAATPAAPTPAAATPPAATPAVAAAPPAPPPPPGVSCPLGTIGMWSQPDIIGTPVYICRQLNPPR